MLAAVLAPPLPLVRWQFQRKEATVSMGRLKHASVAQGLQHSLQHSCPLSNSKHQVASDQWKQTQPLPLVSGKAACRIDMQKNTQAVECPTAVCGSSRLHFEQVMSPSSQQIVFTFSQ